MLAASMSAVVPEPAVRAGPVHGRRIVGSLAELGDVAVRAELDDDAVLRVARAHARSADAEWARGRRRGHRRSRSDVLGAPRRRATAARCGDEDQHEGKRELHDAPRSLSCKLEGEHARIGHRVTRGAFAHRAGPGCPAAPPSDPGRRRRHRRASPRTRSRGTRLGPEKRFDRPPARASHRNRCTPIPRPAPRRRCSWLARVFKNGAGRHGMPRAALAAHVGSGSRRAERYERPCRRARAVGATRAGRCRCARARPATPPGTRGADHGGLDGAASRRLHPSHRIARTDASKVMVMKSSHRLFRDRKDGGRQLATRLRSYVDASPIVLGLPRGGVPVAYEVARALGAPLDVCVVRKIGAPIQPELGIGAVSEEGALYVNSHTMDAVGVSEEELAELIATKRAEVEERVQRFRRGAPPLDVRGKTVIVVDDGIATGGTARAALRCLRARGADRIVLAVPVAATESLEELASLADEVVCLHSEEPFFAVGLWYDDFTTTTDDDVVALLDRARSEHARAEPRARSRSERVRAPIDRDVRIPLGETWLEGRLTIPPGARGLVLFAHGSGSSRHSPRNQLVAAELRQREPRDAPSRPPDGGRGGGRRAHAAPPVRHPAPGVPARHRDRLGACRARDDGARHRLLRREHRGGGSARRCRRAPSARPRGRLARRSSGSGRRVARAGQSADAAPRRQATTLRSSS